jgi:DnaJ-class molecular chaperone
MFGIYEKNGAGAIDRRECVVCHGDHCPYITNGVEHGRCPQCFGTGMAPSGVFDFADRADAYCARCGGTGRI